MDKKNKYVKLTSSYIVHCFRVTLTIAHARSKSPCNRAQHICQVTQLRAAQPWKNKRKDNKTISFVHNLKIILLGLLSSHFAAHLLQFSINQRNPPLQRTNGTIQSHHTCLRTKCIRFMLMSVGCGRTLHHEQLI